MKTFVMVLFAALVLPAARADSIQAQARARARATLWEKAAVDREIAALVLEQEAKTLLASADADKARKDADRDEGPRVGLLRAGGIELKAAEMQGNACLNHEKCAQNWINAADQWRLSGNEAAEKSARTKSEASTKRSFEAAVLAAVIYERAAESLGPDGGSDAVRAARASEKAAEWRERVAERGPVAEVK